MIETNKKINNKNVTIYEEENYDLSYPKYSYDDRPVIVGFGPAGMFAALYLSRYQYHAFSTEVQYVFV